jgi:hypothetical protein
VLSSWADIANAAEGKIADTFNEIVAANDPPVLEKPIERELLENVFGGRYALQHEVARTA